MTALSFAPIPVRPFPEMTFRAPAVVPPTIALVPVAAIPSSVLGIAAVPAAFRPM